ncbi:MAG: DUF3575 domain-containing protein [Tannerella sp.]|jgi:hypothetical protein|nr:DUF3575 domain-containing protein [Tannerella sp.]
MKNIALLLSMLVLAVTGSVTRAFAQEMALKTNLLYDATTTMNLGYEVALGKKVTLDIGINYNPWTLGYKWVGLEGTDNRFVEQRKSMMLKHWMIQPELRWWSCEKFNGHFFGIHLLGGQFSIGAIDLPFDIGRYKDENGDYYGTYPADMVTAAGDKVTGVQYKPGSGDDYYKPLAEVLGEKEARNQIIYRNVDRDGVYINTFDGWFIGAGVSYGYHWILSPRFSMEFSLGVGYAYIDYEKLRCVTCKQVVEKDAINYFGATKAGISVVYMLK